VVYGDRALMTRYAYDPISTRLARMRSETCTASSAGRVLTPAGTIFQDLGYGFDLSGNLVSLADSTPEAGVGGGATLDRDFSYDSLYRVVSATGRESTTPPAAWPPDRRDPDPTATQAYTEVYAYDDAANLTSLDHQPPATGYTRTFALRHASNRLDSVTEAGTTRAYSYDASGNLVKEDADRRFDWDYADRLSVFRTQSGTAAPTTHARHLYDASGRLVKKLVWRGAGQYETTVYVDGVFERRARIDPAGATQHDLLHVMDDNKRVGVVRVGPEFDGGTAAPVVLHLADHIESASVLVEPDGTPVGREEYLPYGETSLGGLERNGYRFTGQERHPDSGLSYHGNRWYAPWLARFASCDPQPPKRPGDGTNQYTYVRGNPLSSIDPAGLQDEPLPEGVIPVDGTPIPLDPTPQFPKWFTADQKKAYIDAHQALGFARSRDNRDPDTGLTRPPRDPYTKYEHRVFMIGDLCRHAIILIVTWPGFFEWTIFEAVPEAEIQSQLITELDALPMKGGSEQYFVGNTASPELAQAIENLQAQGVPVRGNFVHVEQGSPFYADVVKHGGAYHQLSGELTGTTFLNMRILGRGVYDRELGTFLTTPQVLQHEMGHFGQGAMSIDSQTILGAALYRAREAQASMCAARSATNAVDEAALLYHAQQNVNVSQQLLAIPP
jgi:RHS repeat-associated protein